MKLLSETLQTVKIIILALILTTGISYVFAWTGPIQGPPNGNTPAPINVGTTNQVKNAGLGINALSVFGDGYLSGDFGIGTSSPFAKLDVVGGIKFGYDSDDCDGSKAGTTRYNFSEARLELCDGSEWSNIGSTVDLIVSAPTYSYVDADTISLTVGGYFLKGRGVVYWDNPITLDITGLTAGEWTYIYLDYSAISSSGIITASEFTFSNTVPSYSDSKHGWYNGNDRAVFAVLADSSGNIYEFVQDGDSVFFHKQINLLSTNRLYSWTEIQLIIPKFAKIAFVWNACDANYGYTDGGTHWRTKGFTGYGHKMCEVDNRIDTGSSLELIGDENGKIEVTSDIGRAYIYLDGYRLPSNLTETIPVFK